MSDHVVDGVEGDAVEGGDDWLGCGLGVVGRRNGEGDDAGEVAAGFRALCAKEDAGGVEVDAAVQHGKVATWKRDLFVRGLG